MSKRKITPGDPSIDEETLEHLKAIKSLFSKGKIKNLDTKTLREAAEILGEVNGRIVKYLSIRAQQGYKGR
jgi:ArsR family metal-binding transcriptional regulator